MGIVSSLIETVVLTIANVFAGTVASTICEAGIPLITEQFGSFACTACDFEFTGVNLPFTFTGVEGSATCSLNESPGAVDGTFTIGATGEFGLSSITDIQSAFGEGDIAFGFDGSFDPAGDTLPAFECDIDAALTGVTSSSLGTVTLDPASTCSGGGCSLGGFDGTSLTIDCGATTFTCNLALQCTSSTS